MSGADEASQRESLASQLERGQYDCVICVETVRSTDAIWSCTTCYGLVHTDCLWMWVQQSPDGGTTFRCPMCQAKHPASTTVVHRCFCGKVVRPPPLPYETPHCCGDVCGKRRSGGCSHPCAIKCHPGPCPPCLIPAHGQRCYCKKVEFSTHCSDRGKGRSCGEVCGKMLSCGRHRCTAVCHPGDCDECGVEYPQRCFCAKQPARLLPCALAHDEQPLRADEDGRSLSPVAGEPRTFTCGETCGKVKACGKHPCTLGCHAGECEPCSLTPERATRCACGKAAVEDLVAKGMGERKSCTDPLLECGAVCGKSLACGKHKCFKQCHNGPCPPCQQPIPVKCRCGSRTVTLRCCDAAEPEGTTVETVVFKEEKKDLDIFSGTKGKKKKQQNAAPQKVTLPVTCAVRCSDKKNCLRHTCGAVCCPERGRIHLCRERCNRPLACGNHRCEEPCHPGGCGDCLEGIFTELSCRCGGTVIIPPIPCGTEPPRCPLMCSVPRPCGHSSNHTCHFEHQCPPCTEMVTKRCASHREPCPWLTPCYVKNVVCKRRCAKPLECGHRCSRNCHVGPCGECQECTVRCDKELPCGHRCAAQVHEGDCPQCSQVFRVSCDCRATKKTIRCAAFAPGMTLPCGPQCGGF